jgi:frataxin-like iron-binding protein CyaY
MKITATTKLHGVELGDDLADAMSQAIADKIDWDIMCDLMTQVGWHTVKASTQYSMDDYAIVKEWLNKNIKGHYKFRFNTWIFEQSEDAMWFALRWS